jgi:NAD-dependent dihydropyrimidine dehydrogenase PreA subunit
VPNLNGYLKDRKGKTAIVSKPCDARAVAALVSENQLRREDVYIIGLTCGGMTDAKGSPLHACLECGVIRPPVYDSLIDDPGVAQKAESENKENRQLSLDNNFQRFEAEMEKCILCYSCRQACYGCYCHTCFMDRGIPDWQPAKPGKSDKMLYHAGRTMHLAGRCVECGACENACASGVDIRYLIRDVTNFVEKLYDYRAGMDPEAEPAMLTYATTDREVGFLGDTHG